MKTKRILSFMLSFIMVSVIAGEIPAMAETVWSQEQYYIDSITKYNDFDYSDPQHISDKEFFGEWDAQEGMWKEDYIPYFWYEEFPGLSKVEEAAKNGDYETCKEELLEYYREKSGNYNMGYPGRSNLDDQTRARAEMAFSNMAGYSYTNTAGRTYFTKNESEQGINISSDFKSYAKSVNSRIYSVIAAEKDGYRVEIDDSINKPYIIAEINGSEKLFPVVRTTYIDGNVSSQAELEVGKLLVEESVTSIGNLFHRDRNGKRAFLQFDFSSVTENDQIGNAVLYLHGKMVEDDIPELPRTSNEYKVVHVFPWNGEQEIKGDLTYDKFGTFTDVCYNLDGEAGPRPSLIRETDTKVSSRAGDMVLSALKTAYQATGDETFAYHLIRQYLNHAIYFGNYEEFCTKQETGEINALDVARAGYTDVWEIDTVMNSKYMTPEAFTIILKHFHIRAKWLEEHWEQPFEEVNHGGYGVKGLLGLGMFFNEFTLAHGPLELDENGDYVLHNSQYPGSVAGGWLQVANYRNSYKIGSNMYADGSSVEGSISYSFESLDAYLTPMNYGEKLNFDVSEFYTPLIEDESDYIYAGKQNMISALKYLASSLSPGLGNFQVGDEDAWTHDFSSYFKDYLKFIDDPFLEYISSKRKNGEEPDFQTVVYDDADVATLRNGWDDYAVGAAFGASGGRSHDHNNDLAISLIAYGNYLLVDPRMGNYDEEDRSERWVSSTRGHNTIEINDTGMRGNKTYAVQYDPIVFATELDENGQEIPRKDADGIEMKDDPLYVPINQTTRMEGYLYPEDRELNTVYDYIRAKTNCYTENNAQTLYNEDFDLQRNVLFLKSGYFVVTDYGKPEFGINYKYKDVYQQENNIDGHKYKQLWHFLPEANIEIDKENNTMRTNFNGKANIIVATVKNNDNMTANTKYGLYPSARSVFEVCKYGTFEQYKKGIMTFNSLLYPMRAGENAQITTKNIELDLPEDAANAFTANIKDTVRSNESDVYYYTLLDKSQKKPITFGAYNTDGSLALGEKKEGQYVNAVLREGTTLENLIDNEYVIYSTEEIEDIGVYWQLDEIDIAYNTHDEYNQGIDLSKLTVKANGTAKTVRLNGENIEFKQKGRYIYFGENPILDDEDILQTPGEDNSSENAGNHANAGESSTPSSSGGGAGGSSDKKEESTENKENISAESPDTVKLSGQYQKELGGHWAEKEISSLVNAEIVQGFGDGTLGLDRSITRAQFITMLVRALEIKTEEYRDSFSDVSADNWHAPYMETAFKNGWIEGDGTNCYPDRNITREEITKILVCAFEQKYGEIILNTDNSLADSEDISAWAKNFINKAVSSGLVNGMGDGVFKPKENAKREQAMVLVYRLINKQ